MHLLLGKNWKGGNSVCLEQIMYEETANIFDNNNSSSAMDFGSVHNPKRKRIDDICPEQTPETTPVYSKNLYAWVIIDVTEKFDSDP